MEVKEIRRKNINYWADRLGRLGLAEKAGYYDSTHINQLCTGHGSFGGRTARKIEKALGLETGWFDVMHLESEGGRASKILSAVEDFSDAELNEVLAQIELIGRRKRGEFG